mgnify:CR=1 FL=1
MKAIILLFMIVLITSFGSYAQKNDCDNYKALTSEALIEEVGKMHVKKLRESFRIFETLLKTRETESFLKKADDDFKIFGNSNGNSKNSFVSILNQISFRNICISYIAVDGEKISSIFFSDAENPDDKMVLKISEEYKYLSWDNEKTIIKGSVHLEGDVVTIPLAIIRDWPFIDGEINGVKGRWQFDTGNASAIDLHSKKVVGAIADTIGSGFVGSGQTFEVLEYPLIDKIKVGDIIFDSVPHVKAKNMYYLEDITTTVIGQVGFNFFKGYDMKIDYLRSELTFYKQKKDVENWKDIKNYITSLPYFTRRLDNHPMIKIQHKGIDFLVTFDSGGGKGSVIMEDSHFEKLKNEGDIEDFYDEPSPLYNWYNIKIDERLTINLYGLHKRDYSPAHKPLQITEKNTFTLDHSFLSQYITIWDTKNKVIHVLEKK